MGVLPAGDLTQCWWRPTEAVVDTVLDGGVCVELPVPCVRLRVQLIGGCLIL